ncbi:hypothetical protein BUE80_DR002817 [Diplocarpon rosae]|nr:hypothetical protein BUE80_DR002817 [Diplocarpon rosae]
METVVASCIKCKSELGRFWNSWNGIGNTYHSPVHPPISVNGLESTGLVYNGAEDSAVEHRNQLIMRLTGMSVVSVKTGQKAKILVLKTFPLKITSVKWQFGARRDSTCRSDSHIPPPGLGSMPAGSQSVVARIPAADGRSLAPLNVPVADIVKFKNWAEDAISTQQADIERISGTVNRIERDMRSLKDFMLEMRSKCSSSKQLPTGSDEGDVQALRDDLGMLRQKLKQNAETVSLSSTNLLGRIELVSQEVEEIGRKAYEVDDLRSDFELMKRQAEHLEETRAIGLDITAPSSDMGQSPILGSSKRDHDGFQSSLVKNDRYTSPKRRKLVPGTSGDENANRIRDPEKILGKPTQERGNAEIASSEAGSISPVCEQNENHDQVSRSIQVVRASMPDQMSANSVIVARRLSGNRRIPPVMKSYAAKDGVTPAPSHTSRIQVVVPYSPAISKTSPEQEGKFRNANNRTNGRTIKRSLRLSGRVNKGKSVHTDPGFNDNSNDGYNPASIMRSIENRLSTRVTSSRASISSFPAPPGSDCFNEKNREEELASKCDSCGMGYDNVQDLDNVSPP